MAKSFKDIRRERKKLQNTRDWDHDDFKFQSRTPPIKVELEADRASREAFFEAVEGKILTESQLVEKAERLELLQDAEAELGGKIDDVESETREEFLTLQDKLTNLAPPETPTKELKEQDNWDEIVQLSDEVFELRTKLVRISNLKRAYTDGSANDIADETRQNCLVVNCTYVDVSDKDADEPEWVRVWEDIDEFLEDEDPLLAKAAKYQFYLLTLGLKDESDTINLQIPELRIRGAVEEIEEEDS